MGSKPVLFALLSAGAMALSLLLSLSRTERRTLPAEMPSPPLAAATATTPAPEPGSPPAPVNENQGESGAATQAPDLEPPTPEAYAEQRIEELQALGMSGDTNSLRSILSELTNRDPRVRQAARNAAVQFGSRDALPALADAWSQTDDPEEKVALQKAIDFLKLPSWGELNAQR